MAADSLSEVDSKMLAIVQDLYSQLEIKPAKALEVTWEDYTYGGKGSAHLVPSDQCVILRHQLVVPKRMRGKLTPEEWRPIIASYLLTHHGPLARKQNIDWLVKFTVPLVLLTIAIYTLFHVFIPSAAGIPIVAFILVFVFGSLVYLGLVQRRIWLLADRRAADLFGATYFLEVLKKIDSLRLPDEERMKKKSLLTRLVDHPSISERIRNLTDAIDLAQTN